ncbi:DUF1801 domain-containing protein [Sphingomonas xanthus]|uniref:DUF1801 domain-containing protein n=1 Tax=Sphingomonas xanthus TaxID=2594473 RepID=A0A516IRD8_9SPHN|nr:DUF1801 domain-containing protein [Sphingomonas xanthus]QDP19460.1 DUF1801 domain-containing protein [Sphingomonas xanthus]
MAKYEAKTKPTEVSVEEFIAAVADERRRAEAGEIDTLLRRVSGHPPKMWGPSIVGYGDYHYHYASGHEGNAPRIGFSPRKAELVVYLMGNYCDRQAEADQLFTRLGRYKVGKSCLYIRKLADVDMDVLERLAEISWASMNKLYPPSA